MVCTVCGVELRVIVTITVTITVTIIFTIIVTIIVTKTVAISDTVCACMLVYSRISVNLCVLVSACVGLHTR